MILRKYVINILIVCICLIVIVPNFSQADVTTVIDPKNFDPAQSTVTMQSEEADKTAGIILGALRGVGTIVSVLSLVIIGIKYMVGSIEARAEYKQTMIPYLIGAILVFATVNIVDALYKALK